MTYQLFICFNLVIYTGNQWGRGPKIIHVSIFAKKRGVFRRYFLLYQTTDFDSLLSKIILKRTGCIF